jgi:hypothetical protein
MGPPHRFFSTSSRFSIRASDYWGSSRTPMIAVQTIHTETSMPTSTKRAAATIASPLGLGAGPGGVLLEETEMRRTVRINAITMMATRSCIVTIPKNTKFLVLSIKTPAPRESSDHLITRTHTGAGISLVTYSSLKKYIYVKAYIL